MYAFRGEEYASDVIEPCAAGARYLWFVEQISGHTAADTPCSVGPVAIDVLAKDEARTSTLLRSRNGRGTTCKNPM